MKNVSIITLKIFTHIFCLFAFAITLVRLIIGFAPTLPLPPNITAIIGSIATWMLTHNIPTDLGPDPVNRITHITGDCTLTLLIFSLAITPLRRIPGLSWLIRFRRLLGLYAFFYATLHLTTYFWLYSNFDFHAIAKDVFKRPFITMGMFAWLCLLPLALTSTAWSIRKLGGKNWQRLHRLAYVAAIAGIIHYWWLVKTGNLTPLRNTILLTILLLARVVYTLYKRHRRVKINTVPA